MTAVIDPARYLAAEVIFYALVDLIRQSTQAQITNPHFDDAARFFAEDDHVIWCRIADIDPDAVKRHAINLAAQYRAWVEHPHLFPRPRIQIDVEEWRRLPK